MRLSGMQAHLALLLTGKGKASTKLAEVSAHANSRPPVYSLITTHPGWRCRACRLERLWAVIEKYVDQYGVFQAGEQPQKQSGVLRINCIDCLDRTNVVQGWLARKQLDKLLTRMGLLTPGSSITDTFPEVRQSGACIAAPGRAAAQ